MFVDSHEKARVTQAMTTWLRIRWESGLSWPLNADDLGVLMAHSALLDRLLQGKDPLPEAPPRAFSYPWYELIERGSARAMRVSIPQEESGLHDGMLLIEQEFWKIIETVSATEWIATYYTPDTKMIAAFRKEPFFQDKRSMRTSQTRWSVKLDAAANPDSPWVIELIKPQPEAP